MLVNTRWDDGSANKEAIYSRWSGQRCSIDRFLVLQSTNVNGLRMNAALWGFGTVALQISESHVVAEVAEVALWSLFGGYCSRMGSD